MRLACKKCGQAAATSSVESQYVDGPLWKFYASIDWLNGFSTFPVCWPANDTKFSAGVIWKYAQICMLRCFARPAMKKCIFRDFVIQLTAEILYEHLSVLQYSTFLFIIYLTNFLRHLA